MRWTGLVMAAALLAAGCAQTMSGDKAMGGGDKMMMEKKEGTMMEKKK
jgi:hypothetical protein